MTLGRVQRVLNSHSARTYVLTRRSVRASRTGRCSWDIRSGQSIPARPCIRFSNPESLYIRNRRTLDKPHKSWRCTGGPTSMTKDIKQGFRPAKHRHKILNKQAIRRASAKTSQRKIHRKIENSARPLAHNIVPPDNPATRQSTRREISASSL